MRFAQLKKTATHDNTILRMSAYATLCPRFRKINLAEAGIVQAPRRGRRPGERARFFAFLRRRLRFD